MDEIESCENIARLDNIFDIIYAKSVFDILKKENQVEHISGGNAWDFFYQVETDKVYTDFVNLVRQSNIPDNVRVYYQLTFLQSTDWKNTILKTPHRASRIIDKVEKMIDLEPIFNNGK